MLFWLSQPTFPAVTALGRRFAKWWWKEFLDLMPEPVLQHISGRGRKRLTLSADPQGILLTLSQGTAALASEMKAPDSSGTPEYIDRFLLRQRIRRSEIDLGVELPCDAVFRRQILLPAEAANAIDTIVAQDLARKTPFRASDVYSDYDVTELADGKTLDVRQWVVRRQFVHDAALALGIPVEQIDMVTSAVEEELLQPHIRLRRGADGSSPLRQRLAVAMACSAVLLVLACGGLRHWNQQLALDHIESEIAATSRKAQQVRAVADQLMQKRDALLRLRLQRSDAPGLIDLWEEMTRILPSHTWLTEMRLSEGSAKGEPQVTLTGFSSAAPGLVGTIDGSRLLFDAVLTSPVTLDPAEGRERFSLQAKVRLPDVLKDSQR